MKPTTAKDPVRIRFKELKNGSKSIYLDHTYNGRREKEYLKMYLIPERTHADKMQNAETLRTAQAIKAQRVIMMQNDAHGFNNSRIKGKTNFIAYLRKYAEKCEPSNARNVLAATEHLKRYGGEGIQIQQIDKAYILGFLSYLDGDISRHNGATTKGGKPIAQNTKSSYFRILVTILNKAVREGLIMTNPANELETRDKPKKAPTKREYLTLDEVRTLSDVSLEAYPDIKRAFLFACFCGLRYCDIQALRWANITKTTDGGRQVEIIQQKTKEPVYLPLSANALQWMPERSRKSVSEKVFRLPVLGTINYYLKLWAKEAGIFKPLTFHIARHTFATLTLTYGADIYTVSKLLGHTNIHTTQIYAKIVDENKRKAVELIPTL